MVFLPGEVNGQRSVLGHSPWGHTESDTTESLTLGFPGGAAVKKKKNLPAHAGAARDAVSIPGLGRSPGGGNGDPLQCSCLENPHVQRSLAGYSPQGCTWSDTAEQAHKLNNLEGRSEQAREAQTDGPAWPEGRAG